MVADTSLGIVGGVGGGVVLWMQGIVPAGSWLAMMAAAFVGAFIPVVVRRPDGSLMSWLCPAYRRGVRRTAQARPPRRAVPGRQA